MSEKKNHGILVLCTPIPPDYVVVPVQIYMCYFLTPYSASKYTEKAWIRWLLQTGLRWRRSFKSRECLSVWHGRSDSSRLPVTPSSPAWCDMSFSAAAATLGRWRPGPGEPGAEHNRCFDGGRKDVSPLHRTQSDPHTHKKKPHRNFSFFFPHCKTNQTHSCTVRFYSKVNL